MRPELARETYRRAWHDWCLTVDPGRRRALEQLMDSLQPDIAKGPHDPAWREFAASLPGFLDFWGRLERELEEETRR